MHSSSIPSLVSTEWLAEHLDEPDLKIVDASWHLPTAGRDPRAEFQREHIPGAVFFDIDDVCDDDSDLPHMLPSPVKFSSRARRLGLGSGSRIVVYDTLGIMSAARVWWMFRAFGHDEVAVLDGGLKKWKAEERPVENLPLPPHERHFTARLNQLMVRDIDDVRRALDNGEQLLDARSADRFSGAEPEPREGLRAGHIPGSRNLPFGDLLAKDGTMLGEAELKARFEAAGIDLGKPVITTCGSGVTACVLALALDRVGHRDVSVYDGSWAEWGARDDLPVATGKE